MTTDTTAPSEIRVSADRQTIVLTNHPGRPDRITALRLRASCRCAACRRAALGTPAAIDPSVAITSVTPMGGNAVNITFSDGHDRGVFPWDFLRSLAEPTPLPIEAAP